MKLIAKEWKYNFVHNDTAKHFNAGQLNNLHKMQMIMQIADYVASVSVAI